MIQEFKIKILLLVSCLIRIWDNFSRRVSINPQNRMGKIMQVTIKVMGANSRRISKGSFKGREGFHPQINMEPLGSKDIHLLNMEAPRTLECHRVNLINHHSMEVNLNGEDLMQISNSNLHQWVNLKALEDFPTHNLIPTLQTSITSLQTGSLKFSKSVKVH